MEVSDVALLTSPEGRSLLARLPPYDARDALRLGEDLRRAGHLPSLVAAALTQSRLRTRAGGRWGAAGASLLTHLLLTPDGAEQATRPSVSALRAERYRRLPAGAVVADLGCGVGLDALALADAGLRVAAYDIDPLTAEVARVNATMGGHGDAVTVTRADVMSLPREVTTSWDGAFADPARRQGGRRLLQPKNWLPPLSWVLELPVSNLGVKIAPGLDRDRVPGGTEFAVLSDGGDVVEAALYRGAVRDLGVARSATLLPSRAHLTDADLPAQPPRVGPVGRYLHEPDGAVIRAGLVAAVVQQVDGWLIDPQIAYLCTDEPVASPFVSTYEVLDALPFSLKRLRNYLRQHDVGQVVVKKRGSALDVEELRRSLRLDRSAPGHRTIVLTRIGDDPRVVICRAKGETT